MQIQYVSRRTWGARNSTELFIANRISDPLFAKNEIHVHHTAAIDGNDNTPNRWDYEEAVAYMKRLETVRPELGPLPYSENYAVSEDLSVVWVFEGRGWVTRGAHTGGHNVNGVGLGALGNFNRVDLDAAAGIINAMEVRVNLKRIAGLYRLGEAKNPKGWNAWGHRDSKETSCPGATLYNRLSEFRLDNTNTGEDGMLPLKFGHRSHDIRLAKDRMNTTYGINLDLEGNNRGGALYDQALKNAALSFLVKYTGDKSGKTINAKMWNGLMEDYIRKTAPAQSGGVSRAAVQRMIDASIAGTTLTP